MAVSLFARKLKANFYQQIRNGYIVLLPEVSSDPLEKNPMFRNGFPSPEVTYEKCINVLGTALVEFEHSIREIENSLAEARSEEKQVDVFKEVVDPLETSIVPLDTTWGLLKTMYLSDSRSLPPETYMPLHDRARRARALKYHSYNIYRAFKECDTSKLTEEESRVVSKYLIEGKLNGLELQGEDKEIFILQHLQLSKLYQEYVHNAKVCDKLFRHTIKDPSIVADFPKELLDIMARNGGWEVNLERSIYPRVLEVCPDRMQRKNAWLAATKYPPDHPELNNARTVEKIREGRRCLAKYLGYETFADMSMETKMAGSVKNVIDTINKVLEHARPLQEEELGKLQEFANQSGFKGVLERFDIPFWARQHRKHLFQWEEEMVREYFPYERVLSGLVRVVWEALGLKLEPCPHVPTHSPHVTYYTVGENDSPIAYISIDPFNRVGKVSGGHSVCVRPSGHALHDPPLASLIFDFPPPSADKPSLLSFQQVENFFFKFGSALQHVLSTVNYSDVSGQSFIEWDAVEIVSNILSLSLNSKTVLGYISGHYQSGKPLEIDDISAVRRHMAGYNICLELYKSLLDLQMHATDEFHVTLEKQLWKNCMCLPYDRGDDSIGRFVECVVGPYSAGYYSKFWARMLATDAYLNTFSHPSVQLSTVGSRFRDTFLAFGGSCHPSEVFRRFQGRDPSPTSLIESLTGRPLV